MWNQRSGGYDASRPQAVRDFEADLGLESRARPRESWSCNSRRLPAHTRNYAMR
jgi:hypothetical protein